MRKYLFFLFVFLSLACMADVRTPEQAAQVAAQFTNRTAALRQAHRSARQAGHMHLAHTCNKLQRSEPAYYVFNQEDNAGFVVVSGDDLAADVLLYSERGQFNPATVNPNLRFWLAHIREEMSVLDESNAAPKTATQVQAIAPLLVNQDGVEIAWNQEAPYYNMCPMDQRDNTRSLTGCVATAAAQIMYKWRYPEKGQGSHSYTWEDCLDDDCKKKKDITLSLKFDTITFDWANMLPTYAGKSTTAAQKRAVAKLMYACGVACDMAYGGDETGGSGAWTDDMAYGLKTYFNYKVDRMISQYSKSAYQSVKGPLANINFEWSVSTTKFEEYFNAELEAGRPILMGGEDASDGGGAHEFVCDGRNTSGYFHINWGWEGECNCYCLLSSLRPAGESYSFSTHIDAVLGLEPAVIDTIHVTGITVTPNTAQLMIKEKATLSATLEPENATVKTVTWSSSDSKVASVSAQGVILGISAGQATITATTKDGALQATCVVTVSTDTIQVVDCDSYSYIFSASTKPVTGNNTWGDYTWNLNLDNGTVQNFDATRGQQLGSSKNPCGNITFSTDNVAECLINDITVSACVASKATGSIAIYIGDKQVGETKTLDASTTSSSDYLFYNTESLQGKLEVRITNLSKAFFIAAIQVNTEPPHPTDVVDVFSSPVKVDKFIRNGQLIIRYGQQFYNAFGQRVE